MSVVFIRLLFAVICMVVGYQIGYPFIGGGTRTDIIGATIGAILAVIVITFEYQLRKISIKDISSAIFGLILGLLVAKLVAGVLLLVPAGFKVVSSLRLALTIIFCYLGMIIVLRSRDEFNVIIPYVKFKSQDTHGGLIVVDTSVIIDGRILDLCQTKFIEGKLVIPRFVLKELQQIADSPDALKRNRGRRGLDILNKIKKSKLVELRIQDEDFPDIAEVDAKIVKLAKVINAKVLTNDYNLNRIAELQGVVVLNINDLVNALKPVVLPGELMEIQLIKEGKEYNQAIGYLDDGTMVVVDNARQLIGQRLQVAVTSVLQTSAGKMIFAKPQNQNHNQSQGQYNQRRFRGKYNRGA